MSLLNGISREYAYISSIYFSIFRLRHTKPDSHRTITEIVEEFGRTKPNNIALLYQDRTHSYADLNAHANRYARWAMGQGVKKGDVVVSPDGRNRRKYLFAWLGVCEARRRGCAHQHQFARACACALHHRSPTHDTRLLAPNSPTPIAKPSQRSTRSRSHGSQADARKRLAKIWMRR